MRSTTGFGDEDIGGVGCLCIVEGFQLPGKGLGL